MTRPVMVLRADASATMGAGHVMRSLALAEAWCDEIGGAAVMITSAPESVVQRVVASGVEVVPAAEPAGGDGDLRQTLEIARARGAGCTVTDGYRFGAEFHAALRIDGMVLLAIDDGAQSGASGAPLILDQNLGIDPALYSNGLDDVELLLGPRYALLRREFRCTGPDSADSPDVVDRILVTLGGGDMRVALLLVLEALAGLPRRSVPIRVVVGPASLDLGAIDERAVSLGLSVELIRGGHDLPELMRWAHLAISGGGSTCWELAFLGVPSVVLELADNQRLIAAGLARAGAVENAGWLGDLSAESLSQLIGALAVDVDRRRTLSSCGRALVDGQGALRVARHLAERVAAGAPS